MQFDAVVNDMLYHLYFVHFYFYNDRFGFRIESFSIVKDRFEFGYTFLFGFLKNSSLIIFVY